MLTLYNSLLKLIVAILLCSIFGGCNSTGPTKPNEPYLGPHPLMFEEFAAKSPLLAQELFKLPELQDGISEKEVTALEDIMKLYDTNPEMFNGAFEQMYKTGIPEVRKYCSPLQAIYWLALDGKEKELVGTISKYDLEFLIYKAWEFDDNNRWTDFNEVTDRLNAPYLITIYSKMNFVTTLML